MSTASRTASARAIAITLGISLAAAGLGLAATPASAAQLGAGASSFFQAAAGQDGQADAGAEADASGIGGFFVQQGDQGGSISGGPSGGAALPQPAAGDDPAPAATDEGGASRGDTVDARAAREAAAAAAAQAATETPAAPDVDLVVEATPTVVLEGEPATILSYTGSMGYEDQTDTYPFAPEISGIYRLGISEMMAGMYVDVSVLDHLGETLEWHTLENGEGYTVELMAGEQYTIEVMQSYSELGAYTLDIGCQKEAVDITGVTAITDSVDFDGQVVPYTLDCQQTGLYHFEISQMAAGMYVDLQVYDHLGQEVGWRTLENGEGDSLELVAGEQYTIAVEQSYDQLGAYTLNIGTPKPAVAIGGDVLSLSDSVVFEDQLNVYTYTPAVSGVYGLEISRIKADTDLYVYVADDLGQLVEDEYIYGDDDDKNLSFNLEAGKSYQLCVEQYNGYDTYVMRLGVANAILDVTGLGAVADEITFDDQENVYTVTAAGDTLQVQVSNLASSTADSFSLEVEVRDSLGNVLGETYPGYSADAPLSIKTQPGSVYSIVVEQDEGLGSYTLLAQ